MSLRAVRAARISSAIDLLNQLDDETLAKVVSFTQTVNAQGHEQAQVSQSGQSFQAEVEAFKEELKVQSIELSVAKERLEKLKSKVDQKVAEAERMQLLFQEADRELQALKSKCDAATSLPRTAADDLSLDFAILNGGRRAKKIEAVEHRGILVTQLDDILRFLKTRCNEFGPIEGFRKLKQGSVTDVQININSIDLYELTFWVIKPLTSGQRCSYVEAVAVDVGKQEPVWFVSHWWGEAIVDFVKCLKEHVSVRGVQPDSSAFWVCAYANNQHELGLDLGTDPMQSSFLKAMELCVGVLLVLDPTSQPFSRTVCKLLKHATGSLSLCPSCEGLVLLRRRYRPAGAEGHAELVRE